MKTKLLLSVLSSCFMLGQAFSQERNCSAMENLEYRTQQNPKLVDRMAEIESYTQQKVSEIQNNRVASNGVITIPVVVHVIYNNALPQENISEAQIMSQITVLNEDFRRTNSDATNKWAQAADSQIEFCMATVDPQGNPTTGITRTSSNKSSWGTNDAMKKSAQGGVDPWDAGEYLNVWVCNIGSSLLGYAQFPGDSASTDGVVIAPQYFGSSDLGNNFYLQSGFDKGRTTTHEVGHFLNLRHIWGDGGCGVDDFVADTPESDASNYGCSTGHVSCGTEDMVQNYMDYSDDSCMNLYTQGQVDRMRTVLLPGGSRASLGASEKCSNVVVNPTCTDGIQNGDETGVDCGGSSCAPCEVETSCTDNEVTIDITFDNYPEETSWELTNSAGNVVASAQYSSANADGSSISEVYCLPNDCYTFTISDKYSDGMCCSYGNGSYAVNGPEGLIASGGSFAASETNEFCFETTVEVVPTCTDGIQNGDETGVDCGGSSCTPCQASSATIHEGSFESGWDGWIDGGSDAYRYRGQYSYENDYSIRLRDNSGTYSSMTSEAFNLAGYAQVDMNFAFYPNSMENGEDFWLSYFDGSSWIKVATWVSGTNFDNGGFYEASVTLSSVDYNLVNGAKFRIQCDASSNADYIYVDQVVITAATNTKSTGSSSSIKLLRKDENYRELTQEELSFYPNPVTNGNFNARGFAPASTYKITNIAGQLVQKGTLGLKAISTSNLAKGVYVISIFDGEETETRKLVIQ